MVAIRESGIGDRFISGARNLDIDGLILWQPFNFPISKIVGLGIPGFSGIFTGKCNFCADADLFLVFWIINGTRQKSRGDIEMDYVGLMSFQGLELSYAITLDILLPGSSRSPKTRALLGQASTQRGTLSLGSPR